jgi:hypothetical protein
MRAMTGVLKRLRWRDAVYVAVVVTFTFLAARVYWLSAIVPAMDYPQYLVFARVVRDWTDPTSPFFGTYALGHWFMPTVLPVHLTAALSHLFRGSLEVAGKVILSAHEVGLVLSAAYLLHVLGRPRWAIVLIFPLIHSRWALVGGFFAYATAMPLVVLTWALAVHWLRSQRVVPGAALATSLCVVVLWHGIGFAVTGLGFAVLWFLWRAPSLGARLRSVLPALPSLGLSAGWWLTTYGSPRPGGGSSWAAPADAISTFVEYVWASVPGRSAQASTLVAIVGLGLVASTSNLGASRAAARCWRVANPFLFITVACLVAYLAMPSQMNRVEGIANRFAYPAVLAFVFAWNLPAAPVARFAVLASVLVLSLHCLRDVAARVRAFDADTRGASMLMDRIGEHETLYYGPTDRGVSKDFAPNYPCLRELQQYATIRHGGLPNSSFAGYGINYVSYVGGRNPMPGLAGPPRWSSEMTKFDYVLVRAGQSPQDSRFWRVDRESGWELYVVCGSARMRECPAMR